jgi:hypothetical protein
MGKLWEVYDDSPERILSKINPAPKALIDDEKKTIRHLEELISITNKVSLPCYGEEIGY